MSKHGRPSLDFQHWRQEQEAAVAERVAEAQRQKFRPLTDGQVVYFNSIREKKITICTGNAGTGKSFVACGHAAEALRTGKVQKVILTRPLVSCGKGYGFRKGYDDEKFAPSLRAMKDALADFMPANALAQYFEKKIIEFMPLDDMRGSSFKNTFLVCDEAQNAEYIQLHMLFTRFGKDSKFVICGDTSRTQTDLQSRGPNPLTEVVRRFQAKGGHKDIGVVRLTRKDIVRDGIVQWLDEALGDEVVEAWYSLKCPGCRARLWYSNGDESDRTLDDVELVQCYACQKAIDLFRGPDETPSVVEREEGMILAPTFPEKP